MIRSAKPRSTTLAALALAAGLVAAGVVLGVTSSGLSRVQVVIGGLAVLALLGRAAAAGREGSPAPPPPEAPRAVGWPATGLSSVDRLAGRLAAAERPGKVHEAGLHDPLTRLPGRPLLLELLQKQLAGGRRSGELTGVILCDIDDLREINGSFGHAAGDRLLQEVARRLSSDIREADSVARTGEDEFTLIVGGAATADDILLVADRILAGMRVPFVVSGREMLISVSMGISVFPRDGQGVEVLLGNAETALAAARARGGNCVTDFGADPGPARRGGRADPQGLDGG